MEGKHIIKKGYKNYYDRNMYNRKQLNFGISNTDISDKMDMSTL